MYAARPKRWMNKRDSAREINVVVVVRVTLLVVDVLYELLFGVCQDLVQVCRKTKKQLNLILTHQISRT